jgi:predicted RNase H-like HicB family nuclease
MMSFDRIVKIRLQAINLRKPMKLKVILEPSDEGGYTIYVPSLPGCISEGDDIDDALANIQEAIELYLEPVDESAEAHTC